MLRIFSIEEHKDLRVYKVKEDVICMAVADHRFGASETIFEYVIKCCKPKPKKIKFKKDFFKTEKPLKLKPLSKIHYDIVNVWKNLYWDRVEILRNTSQNYAIKSWEDFCRIEFNVDANK